MTKETVAYLMSLFPFRLALGIVGILLGLLFARWFWGRYISRWTDAENELQTLRKDIADQTAKNSKLRGELDAKLGLSNSDTTSGGFDWTSMSGVDTRTAQALKAYGISDPEHLRLLSPSKRAELDKYLAVYGIHLDQEWARPDAPSEFTSQDSSAENADKDGSMLGADSHGNSDSGFVAGTPASTSHANRAAGVSDGVGFAANTEDWEHENKKMVSLQSGTSATGNDIGSLELPHEQGPKLNWSSLEGIDPKIAGELDNAGIKNIHQLEAMSYEQRKVFEADLASKGLSWNWNWVRGWKAGLAESHGKQSSGFVESDNPAYSNTGGENATSESNSGVISGDSKSTSAFAGSGSSEFKDSTPTPQSLSLEIPAATGPDTNWSELSELDSELEAELKLLGIKNVDQLASLSFDDRRKLERHFSIKNVNWDWKWLETWRSSQESDGETSGATTSTHLSEKSSSGNDGENDSSFGGTSGSGGGSTSSNPIHGFAAAGLTKTNTNNDSGSASSENVSDPSQRPAFQPSLHRTGDPNSIPVLCTEVPEFRDDLTLLDGIDGPQSIELRKMGIYNFNQLHNLSIEDRARLQGWFTKRGWHLDMNQWRIASDGNTLNPSIEDIQQTAFDVYQHRVYHDLNGGERTDWEQAEWKLRGNPSFGWGVPHEVDDFAVTLTGISPSARDELYRMGLYNRHQIEALDSDARRLLTRWFAGPRFGVDLTQAFGWLSSLKAVPYHLDFGPVYAEPPRQIDDLSLINGVEPATEGDLNRIGIYLFKQIASWSPTNISAISEALQLDDRIVADHWVAQAKKFV